MVKLYNQGVYLLNGSEIVPDGADAVREIEGKVGHVVSKEEAAKETIAYRILKEHNTSPDMEHLRIKFDKLTSHDITFVELFRRQGHRDWNGFRYRMC